jgi:hyperosmotically inducible protein
MKDRFFGNTRRLLLWLLVPVITIAAVGCWNRLGQDAEVLDKNEKIAAQVKVELVKAPGLNAAPINVKVQNGVVMLDGFLEDESQRQRATQAAQTVTGVESVEDNLQVK